MKKTIYSVIVLAFLMAGFWACTKHSNSNETGSLNHSKFEIQVLQKTDSSILVSSGSIFNVRVSNIKTGPLDLLKKVELINSATNKVVVTYIAGAKSDKPIQEQLKAGTFSGSTFMNAANGIRLETNTIVNNVSTKHTSALGTSNLSTQNGKLSVFELNESASTEPDFTNGTTTAPGCTVTSVHNCVAYKIHEMSMGDYLVCLATAPGCYAGLWASCAYDVCIDKKTYVDQYFPAK